MTNGLALAHFRVGRRIKHAGTPYEIIGNQPTETFVLLRTLDGSEQEVTMTRAFLQAAISDESAVLHDPICRVKALDAMPPVTLGLLSPASVLQWSERMIILRGLMPYAGHGPRSATFKNAYESILKLFDWSRANREAKYPTVCSETRLSPKRAHELLREWRHNGGALGSFLTQVTPARRAKRGSPEMLEVRALVQKTARKLPTASATTVHRVAGAAYRSTMKNRK